MTHGSGGVAAGRGRWALGAALAAVAGASAVAWVVRVWYALGYAYQLNYTDGTAANWAAWAETGLRLYPPVTDGPFIHHAYMPLFQGIVHLFGRAGVHSLPALRVVAILPALATAAVLYAVVRRRAGGWVLPLCAAGLWLSWPATYVFSVMVRPEFLGILFAACGMARLRATWWGVAEAVGWFGAAVLCKQPFILAGFSAGIWLLLHNRRAALGFAAGMAVLGVAVWGGARWATGPWFWWHTVVATNNAWDGAPVVRWLTYHATHVAVPVGMAAVACVGEMRRREVSPWAIYFIGAWLSTLLVGKVGADLHYFAEPALPTLVLAASAAAALSTSGTARTVIIGAVLAAGTVAPLLHWPGVRPIYRYDWTPTPEARRERDAVVDWIRAQPGEVLCLDQELVVRAGKRCWIQPWMFAILAREGTFDEKPLLAQVDARQFGAILLPHRVEQYERIGPAQVFYSPGFNAAVAAHYDLQGVLPRADGRPWWYCYVPAPGPGA